VDLAEALWWLAGLWISGRLLWSLWGPKLPAGRRVVGADAHDAAVALAGVLGVRDGVDR
jgi:hypothetical protein